MIALVFIKLDTSAAIMILNVGGFVQSFPDR